MNSLARAAAGAAFAAAALAGAVDVATPAYALAPERTGWWNGASAQSFVAPSTASGGELVVSNGPNGPEAYAAVYYTLPSGQGSGQPSAVLTLELVPSSTVGTVSASACVITSTWTGGGDQPAADGPSYNCTGGVVGTVSADGSSVSWSLGPAQESSGDVYDLALVPDGQLPFSATFAAPGASSLSLHYATAAEPVPPAPTAVSGGGGLASGGGAQPGGSGGGSSVAYPPGTYPSGTVAPTPPLNLAPEPGVPVRPVSPVTTARSPGSNPGAGSQSAAPAPRRPPAPGPSVLVPGLVALGVLALSALAFVWVGRRPAWMVRIVSALGLHTSHLGRPG